MEPKKFEFDETSFNGTITMDSTMNISDECCNMYQNMKSQMIMCPPVHECPQERVCHRYICYEVPHIMPCNTKIINHHIYKHTYTPCYTCCEENVVTNEYGPKCCF